jgi:hypothetical protein
MHWLGSDHANHVRKFCSRAHVQRRGRVEAAHGTVNLFSFQTRAVAHEFFVILK